MTPKTPRIIDDDAKPPELRKALGHAATDGPTAAELEALLAALPPLPLPSDAPPAPPPPPPVTAAGTPAAATGVALKISATLLVVGSIVAGAHFATAPKEPSPPVAIRRAPPPTPAVSAPSLPVLPRPSEPEHRPASRVMPEPSPPTPGARSLGVRPSPGGTEGRAPEHPSAEASIADPSLVSTSAKPSAPPPESPEVRELDLLGPAQRSLPRDPARALELVREHERRFPGGRLREEREVIAIEALARLGQEGAARARYARFERRFPESVHRRKLSSLFERGPASP